MDAEGTFEGHVRAIRYRYRTKALLGRWKNSPRDAAIDAVRAGQAEACETGQHGICWRVPGEIEHEGSGRT